MPKYEYELIALRDKDGIQNVDAWKKLNEMGAIGWHIVLEVDKCIFLEREIIEPTEDKAAEPTPNPEINETGWFRLSENSIAPKSSYPGDRIIYAGVLPNILGGLSLIGAIEVALLDPKDVYWRRIMLPNVKA